MDREELLAHFKEKQKDRVEQARKSFMEGLLEQAVPLKNKIDEQLKLMTEIIKETKKENIMFLYFSLLRADVLQRKYNIMLQAQDFRWYLDDDAIELTFSLDFLFQPVNRLWDELLTEHRIYAGKVNSYDVREIIFEELKILNSSIALVLRYAYRNIEKEGLLADVPKLSYLCMRWGDYRDQTEILVQIDKEKKTEKQWKKELQKSMRESGQMVFGYWYDGKYSASDCSNRDMQFITFEKCGLSDIKFDKSDLTGAMFINTKLNKCSFAGCRLQDADFSDCELNQVDFQDAALDNTIFTADSVPYLKLSPEQLQTVRIKGPAEKL